MRAPQLSLGRPTRGKNFEVAEGIPRHGGGLPQFRVVCYTEKHTTDIIDVFSEGSQIWPNAYLAEHSDQVIVTNLADDPIADFLQGLEAKISYIYEAVETYIKKFETQRVKEGKRWAEDIPNIIRALYKPDIDTMFSIYQRYMEMVKLNSRAEGAVPESLEVLRAFIMASNERVNAFKVALKKISSYDLDVNSDFCQYINRLLIEFAPARAGSSLVLQAILAREAEPAPVMGGAGLPHAP
ncbi:MAG: hypothetical protein Q7V63_01370 [Gammaproteobacteria bacterium]|nr:hypothetical protein [Gammaproteobacteria bacterium]